MNDPDKPTVQSVHRGNAQALLSNDVIVPVTNWFGADGEECEPITAVTCVCGADGVGWYAVDLRLFSLAKVH